MDDLFSFFDNRGGHMRQTEDRGVPVDPDSTPTLKKAKNMLLRLMKLYQ